MLNNIINEIITDYPTEINKPFNNDNQFYLKIKNEFKPLFIEEITRILNEIVLILIDMLKIFL